MVNTHHRRALFGNRKKNAEKIPVTFIQDHVGSGFGPAITSPPLVYTPEVGGFAENGKKEEVQSQEDSLFSHAKVELQELKEAISQYCIKVKPQTQITLNPDPNASTWGEVQDAVQLAAREEGADDESGRAKASCSAILRNLPVFETWLQLLPSGDYGAVIGGLFKMVFAGAKRANEVRLMIFQALADIPGYIARAHRYGELYAESKPVEMMRKTAELCSAVLVSLRHVMCYFTEGILKGGFKAMVQGPAYKKSLQTQLDRVKDLTITIDEEASIQSQHRLKNVEDFTVGISRDLRELRTDGRYSLSDERLEKFAEVLMPKLGAYVVNSMLSHVSSNPCIDGSMTWSSSAAQLLATRVEPSALLCPKYVLPLERESLLTLLGISPGFHDQSLRCCLAKGNALGIEDADRVKWVMRSSQLREWITSSQSKVLLINGNSDIGSEDVTATTFLSAKIVESLSKVELIVVLRFFGSLHAKKKDGVTADAAGLMKGVLSQLIMNDTYSEQVLSAKEELQGLEDFDVEGLCKAFRVLVGKLPPVTVLFLIIDGVSLYERAQRRKDFLKAMKIIIQTMQECHNTVFKLLLTCQGRSIFLKDYIKSSDVLTVPLDIDGEGQGWSEHSWKRIMGADIGNLGAGTA